MLQDQLKPLMSYQQQIVAGGQFFRPPPLRSGRLRQCWKSAVTKDHADAMRLDIRWNEVRGTGEDITATCLSSSCPMCPRSSMNQHPTPMFQTCSTRRLANANRSRVSIHLGQTV